MSNFIYRSLDYIEKIYNDKDSLYDTIKNNISNIKIKEIKDYQDICKYLNNGFLILLIEDDYSLALEVKKISLEVSINPLPKPLFVVQWTLLLKI